jgi:hypothetical protein
MALQLNYSVIEHTKDVLLDPTVDQSTLERGQLMVDAGFNASGERLVAPSAAGAGEVPVGFLLLSEKKQATIPYMESLSVPGAAPLTVTLKFTPTAAAAMRAYNADTGATIAVVAGAPGAGQLGLATNVLTADAGLTGVNFVVVYRYTITAQDLARRSGQRSVNNGAEGLYNQVTLAYGNCEVTTSNFDTAALWDVDANTVVASGAAGNVVLTGGAGTDFGTLTVEPRLLLTPGIEQAFLTVRCDLPG